ncbi:phage holin [Marinococcus luteus]|uniref:phage holin n=1 Tax=Marinococcus luteus TaxID=1122204 RepID=UPI002ACCC21F|nr:phage holin [Marinococcus luteus]MDZ5782121.1 phage holin [Marinococcus luteus]
MNFNKVNTPAVRMGALGLTTANQFAAVYGYSPMPIDGQTLEILISTGVFTVVAGWTAWKNNSFSKVAKQADRYLASIKNTTTKK